MRGNDHTLFYLNSPSSGARAKAQRLAEDPAIDLTPTNLNVAR